MLNVLPCDSVLESDQFVEYRCDREEEAACVFDTVVRRRRRCSQLLSCVRRRCSPRFPAVNVPSHRPSTFAVRPPPVRALYGVRQFAWRRPVSRGEVSRGSHRSSVVLACLAGTTLARCVGLRSTRLSALPYVPFVPLVVRRFRRRRIVHSVTRIPDQRETNRREIENSNRSEDSLVKELALRVCPRFPKRCCRLIATSTNSH